MESATQVQILEENVCISRHVNVPQKSMNLSVLSSPPAMGKYLGRVGS